MLQFSRLEASKDAWSNGYTRRLVTEKLWVQILAPERRQTMFHISLLYKLHQFNRP